jgi:replicative DNA helicase
MPNIQLGARLLSMASQVEFWRIFRNKGLSDEKRSELLNIFSSALGDLPIYISDKAQVTLSDIRAKVFKLINLYKCKVIYLDYLQLVTPEEGAGTREQEVAKLSRGLKLLSMQTGIPIIVLAQLSRESEKSQVKKPKLIHLRESGSIEQDADGVMLLHRDIVSGILVDEDGNKTDNQADLIFAKWRNGETFDHKLYFKGSLMEFSEPGEEYSKVVESQSHMQRNQPQILPRLPYKDSSDHPDDTPF